MATNPSIPVLCMACESEACDFKPVILHRRAPGDDDLEITMKYCGVCHSDLHSAAGHLKGALGKPQYPHVPGHELAGIVARVGKNVTRFKVGDPVGVGCMVDSCLSCKQCLLGHEQKCSTQTGTYQGTNTHGRAAVWPPNSKTLGGYTKTMIVHQKFAILIPETFPLEMAGPIMCAGVTMYSPLLNLGCKEGTNVGIIGLGGLGQIGIRIAKAMGANVTAFSTSESKRTLAKHSGADDFVVSTDAKQIKNVKGKFDILLNTISVYHDYCMYQKTLTSKGIQVILGLHAGLGAAMFTDAVTFGNSRIKFSGIGSIKETQDVINLCDQHKIYPEIKIVPVTELNNVYTELDKSNPSGLRYVLDIENSLNENTRCSAAPPNLTPSKAHFNPMSMIPEFLYLLFTFKWW